MKCECGASFPKMRHTIREPIKTDSGTYIIRRRVCYSCYCDHMEKN